MALYMLNQGMQEPLNHFVNNRGFQFRKHRPKVLALILIIVFIACFGGVFSYFSVCKLCGLRKDTTKWHLPLTSIQYFNHSRLVDTPLSQALLENTIVPNHQHQWLFAAGSGNGVTCAIGKGRHIYHPAQSTNFANVVLLLHRYGQTNYLDRLLHGALDPETAYHYRTLQFTPEDPLKVKEELRDWITQELEYIDDITKFQTNQIAGG